MINLFGVSFNLKRTIFEDNKLQTNPSLYWNKILIKTKTKGSILTQFSSSCVKMFTLFDGKLPLLGQCLTHEYEDESNW